MEYLEFITTVLTIILGVLTILTFFNNRKKDSNSDSEKIGAMGVSIDTIRATTEEIKIKVEKMADDSNKSDRDIAEIRSSLASAHKRIDRLEKFHDKYDN